MMKQKIFDDMDEPTIYLQYIPGYTKERIESKLNEGLNDADCFHLGIVLTKPGKFALISQFSRMDFGILI